MITFIPIREVMESKMKPTESTISKPVSPTDWRTLISAKNTYILAAILAGLLIIGSIWDLQISQTLYSPNNPVGIFGAATGELPASMALVASGILLITFRNKERRLLGAFQILAGIIVFALGAALAVFMPTLYLSWPPALLFALSAIIIVATAWGTISASRTSDRKTAIRVAVVFFLVVLIEMLVINILKIGWERPRMRLISGTDEVGFSSWWQPGTPEKAALVEAGADSDDFKSFPSGHTANAASFILLTALVAFKGKFQNRATALFWTGAIWGFFVAFTRITLGAHFVSDTVFGFTVTFMIILIAYRIAFPPIRANDASQQTLEGEPVSNPSRSAKNQRG